MVIFSVYIPNDHSQGQLPRKWLRERLEHMENAIEAYRARCQSPSLEVIVKHSLPNCSQWTEQRQNLQERIGLGVNNLPRLLGNKPEGSPDDWKPDMVMIKAAIQFARETGRLDESRE
ncbi:hypothetical protein RJZ56_001038 [Blastomyces dermatitidis]|uniref:Uncharacterized protein n=2 Tax=Blastomyces TaxID=229219 RepID=A0A179ULM3_BLAGS|nr:uncharacterized protein BDBG_17140 [Blastomyces gilchristii SLH14081]XP_045279667.1 uncharacterized protein BDCG_16390 [Blastomyces dermatitidis ER-3]EQL37225.1 hypothetical protein BDFG_01486 [Blastomyces dermatitidis ATCC 26199]OAS99939.1 hypothetical protein BDCG_16390 [Blastomyces dermatitidis ER-3]OAT08975.1 hypothetical protein BDBG_17140 [Blastomyces gilchristii SLH14081]